MSRNYVMKNPDTGEELTVGSKCIHTCFRLTSRTVVFPKWLEPAAARVNKDYPGSAVVLPVTPFDYLKPENPAEFQYGDDEMDPQQLEALGLDPEDPDWEDVSAEGLRSDEIDWESNSHD
jgi:hypothetical protein